MTDRARLIAELRQRAFDDGPKLRSLLERAAAALEEDAKPLGFSFDDATGQFSPARPYDHFLPTGALRWRVVGPEHCYGMVASSVLEQEFRHNDARQWRAVPTV